MITILLISSNKDFIPSTSELSDKANILRALSGNEALNIIKDKTVNLVIADESLGDMAGLEFAKKLISINPMINCALVSSLSPKDFHEASEGLGLMMQLPAQPEKQHIEKLLTQVETIIQTTGNNK